MKKQEIEKYLLYNDDCLISMKELLEQNIKIDTIITDPPYGIGFKSHYNDSEDFVFEEAKKWCEGMYALLKNKGHLFLFVPTIKIHKWISLLEDSGFIFKNILITRCKYNNYTRNNFKYDSQFILYLTKGKPRNFEKVDIQKTSEAWFNDKRNKNPKEYTYSYTSNMYDFSTKLSKLVHPNEKSVDFVEKLIKISTKEGDIILDPFMGSGTVGVACKKLKRNFIGIEKDKKFFNISRERIEGKL